MNAAGRGWGCGGATGGGDAVGDVGDVDITDNYHGVDDVGGVNYDQRTMD